MEITENQGAGDEERGPGKRAAAVELLESEALTKKLCNVCYGLYMVLGLVLLVAGVIYYNKLSDVVPQNAYISLVMGLSGLAMIVMGGVSSPGLQSLTRCRCLF